MSSGANNTYNVTIAPPDGFTSTVSAIITLDIWMSPTVTFSIWVNNQTCNNPSYTISTTFSGATEGRAYFDCSNVITHAGKYAISIQSSKVTGASNAWLDLTYFNNPSGSIAQHGTEYQEDDQIKVWLQLLDSTQNSINNATCFVDIYTPSNIHYLERARMSFLEDGVYYYDLAALSIEGVYPTISICYYVTGTTDVSTANSGNVTNGTVAGGTTYANTQALDGVYWTINTAPFNGFQRLNFTMSFTNITEASPAYDSFINVEWNGKWNGNTGDNINISIWNFTSTSWVILPNFIFPNAGNAFTVSNAIQYPLGLLNSTGFVKNGTAYLNFLDTPVAGGQKSIQSDYIDIQLISLVNGTWQSVKGSSEIHVTGISSDINNFSALIIGNISSQLNANTTQILNAINVTQFLINDTHLDLYALNNTIANLFGNLSAALTGNLSSINATTQFQALQAQINANISMLSQNNAGNFTSIQNNINGNFSLLYIYLQGNFSALNSSTQNRFSIIDAALNNLNINLQGNFTSANNTRNSYYTILQGLINNAITQGNVTQGFINDTHLDLYTINTSILSAIGNVNSNMQGNFTATNSLITASINNAAGNYTLLFQQGNTTFAYTNLTRSDLYAINNSIQLQFSYVLGNLSSLNLQAIYGNLTSIQSQLNTLSATTGGNFTSLNNSINVAIADIISVNRTVDLSYVYGNLTLIENQANNLSVNMLSNFSALNSSTQNRFAVIDASINNVELNLQSNFSALDFKDIFGNLTAIQTQITVLSQNSGSNFSAINATLQLIRSDIASVNDTPALTAVYGNLTALSFQLGNFTANSYGNYTALFSYLTSLQNNIGGNFTVTNANFQPVYGNLTLIQSQINFMSINNQGNFSYLNSSINTAIADIISVNNTPNVTVDLTPILNAIQSNTTFLSSQITVFSNSVDYNFSLEKGSLANIQSNINYLTAISAGNFTQINNGITSVNNTLNLLDLTPITGNLTLINAEISNISSQLGSLANFTQIGIQLTNIQNSINQNENILESDLSRISLEVDYIYQRVRNSALSWIP